MFGSSRSSGRTLVYSLVAGGVLIAGSIALSAGALANGGAASEPSSEESPAPKVPGVPLTAESWPPGIRPDPDDPMGAITDESAIEWGGWADCDVDCAQPPSRDAEPRPSE